jgi:flagellar motor switch protein FliN
MTTPPSSYDWVREIKPNLAKLDSIPLTGAAPPFPWDELSSRLARSFDREGLSIRPGEMTWRAKENLYDGLGDIPFPLILTIPSLRGQICWVMPTQEISLLTALLLTQEPHPLSFNDPSLSESFYHFLALEVLYNLTQISFDQSLIPLLTHQKTLPNQDSLCWDISLHFKDTLIGGRLIISPEFRRSWVEHFAQESSALSQQMAQLIEPILHVEIGKTHFLLDEWKAVKPGDFILLDHCSLNPENFNGRVILTINGKQVFRAKLKDGTLKILELPLLHEVDNPMVKKTDDDDDLSDLDLPDEDEEFEDDDLLDDTEDDDLLDDTEDDDLFTEEETEEETETEETIKPEEEVESPPPEHIEETSPEVEQKLVTPNQIPLTLTVEIGQIQMTMDQLLKLEPGNLLEIDIHPENGVDLTMNGKKVGKGELIRIGDALGVRVLQIGR